MRRVRYVAKNNAKCYLPRNANFHETSLKSDFVATLCLPPPAAFDRSLAPPAELNTRLRTLFARQLREIFSLQTKDTPIRSFVHNDRGGLVLCVCAWKTVLRIHDILVLIRIWISGSMPLTNGCGSGSCYFRHWPSRCQQKFLFNKYFCLLRYFLKVHIYIIFQR